MSNQLTLAIQINHEATLADFFWSNNELLHQQIQMALQKQGERLIYLWGNSGCGKSHLLQACCQAVSTNQSAIYLPLDILQNTNPEVLEGIEQQSWISIDNLHAIAGQVAWEEALFHLYNRIRDNENSTLLISGTHPPAQLPILLADLRSRLSWGLVIQLNELPNDDKIHCLQLYAKKRGFELPTSVALFLLNRCARNMHDLNTLLDRLDKASLMAHRKITIPFVKHILSI
jgi:DnaA family protein